MAGTDDSMTAAGASDTADSVAGAPLAGRPLADVQATFCSTLVDSWLAAGVRHAVVCPGSRSTPMALALAARDDVHVHVVHDERVGAFVALGLGLDGVPAVLVCTSGTAAANFYPAVVEAGLSEVPMLVITADRPARLRGVGAPQTIDQVDLFGGHVVRSHDVAPPTAAGAGTWRAFAATAFSESASGPVHVNLQFEEPLVGVAADLPLTDHEPDAAAPVPASTTPGSGSPSAEPLLSTALDRQRGVIIAGGRSGVDIDWVAALHARTDWPILADPTSGVRHLDGVVTTFDSLLRHTEFADAHLPEIIVRVGRPPASKFLSQWSKRATDHGALLVQVGGPGRIDPEGNVTHVAGAAQLDAHDLRGATGTTWKARWMRAEAAAERAIAGMLDELTEPAVARTIADHLPSGVGLTVASSMPVRDLEWFGGRAALAHSNRGANGIDGVMSTALGRALGGRPEVVLLGDLAFVHDSGALTALMSRGVDLRIVVTDNDGGGIFSFLSQADLLEPTRFEQLFGTPHGTDVLGLARAHGIPAVDIDSAEALAQQLDTPGPWVARVASDRERNVEVHRMINAAVAAAL